MKLAVQFIFLMYLIDYFALCAPVVIKMDGKKNGKKGGNLILISGGKCGSPTLIKGGKKKGGEMILVGGENCHKEKNHVQVIKQYVPVPYYVPKPIYKYIMRHHYVPVRQVVVKPVPVPYVVKSYKKKPEYSSDSSSGGYGSGGYDSESGSNGLFDSPTNSGNNYGASSSGSNPVPSVGYGSVSSYIPSEYTNGAGGSDSGSNFGGASALSSSPRMNDVGSLYSADSDVLGVSGSSSAAASSAYSSPRGKYSQSVNAAAAAQKHKYYDASSSGFGSSSVASTLSPTSMKGPNPMATLNGNLKASASESYYYGNNAGGMSYDDYSTAIAAKNGYGMYSPVYSSSNGQLYTSGQMYPPSASPSAAYLTANSTAMNGGSYPDVSSLYPSSIAGSSPYGMPFSSSARSSSSSSSMSSSGLSAAASSTSSVSVPSPTSSSSSSYGSSTNSGSNSGSSSSGSSSSTASTKKPSKLKLSYSSEGLKKARKLFTDRFTKRNDDEQQVELFESTKLKSPAATVAASIKSDLSDKSKSV